MSSKISEGKAKILILLTACLFIGANSFQFGDPVRIMVNKISPFTNPTETYKYYDLPFCQPEKPTKESQSFGEKLTGNRKMNSLYQATFGTNLKKTSICEVELNAEQLTKFRNAIKQNYLFEMFIEDAVAGNSIGYVKNGKVYLATHFNFNIFYNKAKGNIIKAQIDYDELYHVVDITNNAPLSVNFTYAVNWGDTSISSPVSNNGNDTAFVSEPHMLTFFNGITINSLLFVILWRIFQKIQKATDPNSSPLDAEAEKKGFETNSCRFNLTVLIDGDFNWKAIRGEVFRAPVFKILLCAGVGSGLQLTLTALGVLVLGAIGMFYQAKGSLLATTAFIYIGASVLSGIASSSLFRYLGGKTWTANLVATFLCFPAPLTIIATVLNNIAWIDQSTAALPFGTVIMLIVLLVIALPLTIIGGVTGRKRDKEKLLEADDKSSKAFSDFFSLKPSHLFMVAVAGLFSFSVLYFELHSIFAAVWARKVYTAYGQLLLTVVLTISITASISIIFTYCQLNNRDCKWWWRSFFYGGSCGFYVFLYAIYFYMEKSHISGFMQTCFYFGYSAMGAFAVFLVLGAASFVGASAFVKQIYERRKVD